MEPAAPERFCDAGRRRAKRVAVATGEPFDEPAPQNRPALRVAPWQGARFVAPLARWYRIALRGAPAGRTCHGASQLIPFYRVLL
jgi:hypothetical protein